MPSSEDPSVMVVDVLQTLRSLYGYLSSGRFLISFKPPLQVLTPQSTLHASEAAAAEEREEEAFQKYQMAIKANGDDDWKTEWKKERKWKHNKGRRH